MVLFDVIGRFTSRWFAGIILLISLIAWIAPGIFESVLPRIGLLLGIVMFGMGATLVPDDFKHILKKPREIGIGFGAQFLLMPLIGWGLALLFRLSPELVAGVLLVGASPGGTASNVMTYIARGDLALSVALTTLSTLAAPFLTPIWMFVLAGHWLEIDAAALFVSIAQIVLLPVLLGLLVRRWFSNHVQAVLPVLPLISILAIGLIVGAVVGANAKRLLEVGFLVLLVVVLHNLLGLVSAWFVTGAFKLERSQRKAVSIEVGMQNSGLAVALASAHLGPLAALPGAIFSLWHNLSGSILANWWNRKEMKPESDQKHQHRQVSVQNS